MHTKFLFENLKIRDCFEDLSIDGRIIFEWILESELVCIHLAHNRN
jgi:hypothetical protein